MSYDITDGLEDMIDAAIIRDLYDTYQASPRGDGSFMLYDDHSRSATFFPGRDGGSLGTSPSPHITIASADSAILNGTTPASVYSKWENRIYELFYPFKTMPMPEDFDGTINALQPVLELLAVDPETFPNVDSGQAEGLGFQVEGNDQFSLISSASGQFALFQGLTAEAFRKYYLDRFPIVTQRQYAVTRMILGAVYGERLVWEKLQQDVTTLVSEGTNAFKESPRSGIDLAVVGAIAGIVGLIPPLATAAGATSAIVGALSVIPTDSADTTEKTYDLPGGDASGTWSAIEDAVSKMKSAARGQEQAIGDHMTTIAGLMSSEPAKFDLGQIDDPGDADNTSEGDEFATETDGSQVLSDVGKTNVEFGVMNQTGEDLKTVAGFFGTAASDLSGVLSSGPWSRSGSIGWGYIGHYDETHKLADDLVTILHNTDQGLVRGGEVVQLAARRFRDTDSQVNAALEQHKAQVDQVEAVELQNAQAAAAQSAPPSVPTGGRNIPI